MFRTGRFFVLPTLVVSVVGLGVTMAPAAGVPVVRECSAIPGAAGTKIECDTMSGKNLLLDVDVHRGVEAGAVAASLRFGEEQLVELHVVARKSSLAVEGQAGDVPFRWLMEEEADGSWRSRHEWGEMRLVATVGGADGSGGAVVEGDPEEYFVAVHAAPQWALLLAMLDVSRRVEADRVVHDLLPMVIAGFSQDPNLMRSPIGKWLDCLKETCQDCNGCWDGGCGPCPDDPLWAAATIYACYAGGSVLCLGAPIWDLLPKITDDGDVGPGFTP